MLNPVSEAPLEWRRISIATACHQAWSANNMLSVASGAFPSRAVGSVVGFGGMCGMLMLLVAGGMPGSKARP